HHLVTAGGEELCDEASVAALPGRFGAHEAGARFGKRLAQGRLPGGGAHAGRVAGELAEAREQLLAWLLGAEAAELDHVSVRDAGVRERRRECSLVELRVPARRGKAADVD